MALDCGEFDFSTVIPDGYCRFYDGMSCGTSEYFRCLYEESECDEEEGIFTLAKGCRIPESCSEG